ncbi:MAG: LTA synthase family protein [Salibacteraceae bacterium]
MIKSLKLILNTCLIWLLYFFVNRLIFSFLFFERVYNDEIPFSEILTIVPKSFRLDMSFISYMMGFSILLIFLNSFFSQPKVNRVVRGVYYYFHVLMFICSGLVVGSEASLYTEWSTKLSFTALRHMQNPKEVFATASGSHYLITALFLIPSLFFAFFLLKKCVVKSNYFNGIDNNIKTVVVRVLALPVLFVFVVISMRGGLQQIPIMVSDSYFSRNIILNDIAVNPNWNLLSSLYESSKELNDNPYTMNSLEDCNQRIAELYTVEKDTTFGILTTDRPNIVFILIESLSADNVESLGGLEGVMTNFAELEKDGYLFDNFYSNGSTSDEGVSSIFSSFPVFCSTPIINQPDKARKLPSLNTDLQKEGYETSFIFGGQLSYGNIKAYLFDQGFNVVKDEEHFGHLPSGRLAIHDEYMFNELRLQINEHKVPFMATLFTASTHSPYDMDNLPTKYKGVDYNQYVNSVIYTDSLIGDFFEKVKDEPWYDNTLFIIVADHSHESPRKWTRAEKNRFKIPMLWYGNVLKPEYKGKVHKIMGSQIDVAKSLLTQMNLPTDKYPWGKNIFNPTIHQFVPYSAYQGYGLMKPNSSYFYRDDYQKVIEHSGDSEAAKNEVKNDAELFIQGAFQTYMDL